ncbi:hypothetical protein AKO1_014617 [Acrasis kona]|uniref:Uncharacterized protein n=1 Tax=Acrasis kona TaxID=1008807 RepID=A0AAW2Z2F6_9EUKA
MCDKCLDSAQLDATNGQWMKQMMRTHEFATRQAQSSTFDDFKLKQNDFVNQESRSGSRSASRGSIHNDLANGTLQFDTRKTFLDEDNNSTSKHVRNIQKITQIYPFLKKDFLECDNEFKKSVLNERSNSPKKSTNAFEMTSPLRQSKKLGSRTKLPPVVEIKSRSNAESNNVTSRSTNNDEVKHVVKKKLPPLIKKSNAELMQSDNAVSKITNGNYHQVDKPAVREVFVDDRDLDRPARIIQGLYKIRKAILLVIELKSIKEEMMQEIIDSEMDECSEMLDLLLDLNEKASDVDNNDKEDEMSNQFAQDDIETFDYDDYMEE